MRREIRISTIVVGFVCVVSFFVAQGHALAAEEIKATAANGGNDTGATSQGAIVPRLIQFSGVLKDRMGQPLTGVQGVTLALYQEQQAGASLWIETQNVTADAEGRFTVLLGAASPQGLPLDLFTTGQARWLGVQAIQSRDSDGAVLDEQPRIYLASVPYALATATAQPAATSAVKALSADAPPQAGVSPQGDITGVIAANGLTGGGVEGDVTLQVRPCDSGQILKWTSGPTGGWTCQRDENSGGTITAVIPQAGSGLTGGGTLGGVTLGIDPNVVPKAGSAFTSSINVVIGGPGPASAEDAMKAAVDASAVTDDPPQSNLVLTQQNTAVRGSYSNAAGAGVGGIAATSDSYGGAFQNTDPNGKSLAALDPSGNDTFVVRSNGNVTVANTGATGYRLDVGGQINASGGLCINGICNASGPVGDITGVTAGAGLTGGVAAGDATLAVDTTAIQSRVTGTCGEGSSIRIVNGDGTVICEIDDSGLSGAGTVTSVASGNGLTGGPITTTGTLAVNFAGSGAANTVARSDHNHDASYATVANVAALLDRITLLEAQLACPLGGCSQWWKRFGDSGADSGAAVAVDSSGNYVVTGSFNGTVDFGGGPLTSAGLSDIFVAKFSGAGTHLWSKRFGGSGGDQGRGVAVDGSGNVVLTGSFGATSGGSVDFGGGVLTSAGLEDIFVAKISNVDGSHVWSQSFGTPNFDQGREVAVDSSGNVVVAGSFGGTLGGTVNFGGANLTSAGDEDIFVAKFSAAGAHQWSQSFGGTGIDLATAVAVDSSGNVLITGRFNGTTVNFGGGALPHAGSNDIFVAKFSGSGVHQWSKSFGGISDDRGLGVAVDSSGNVVVTGHFIITVDFGGGPLTSTGVRDIFVAKYSGAGVHIWSQRFGSSGDDRSTGLAVDSSGNVVVTGFFGGIFGGTVDFDPVNNPGGELTSAGIDDIFVAKLSGVNGSHLWSRRYGDTSSDNGNGVAVDSSGNVVVTGFFNGTVDFSGTGLTVTSAGGQDIFLLKLLH